MRKSGDCAPIRLLNPPRLAAVLEEQFQANVTFSRRGSVVLDYFLANKHYKIIFGTAAKWCPMCVCCHRHRVDSAVSWSVANIMPRM